MLSQPPAERRTSPRPWSARLRGWAEAERLQRYEDTLLLVLTLLIGASVGLTVVAFILVTEQIGSSLNLAAAPAWQRLAAPVAGAVIAGVLLVRLFPNARGSGIPQTKVALQVQEGFVGGRTVIGKFLCSTLSLGSGIALGREGPTVQIGAGIASVLGRRLGLGPRRVRALVPVGTAAALAAAFNTPISAVLFTLEEVLGDLHAPVLGSVVLSAATSWAVLHLVLGDEPLFHVPAYQLVHPGELIVYAALGVLGGLVAVAFVKLLLRLRQGFLRLPASTLWLQPAAGGLVVGALGWAVPGVLGVGYDHVGQALNDQFVLSTMIVLLGLKLVATASCYASGNAGGIFGPSLFIGAMLGGSVGQVAHAWMPDVTGSPGAYALVGMGTAFAGIIRAPMTSVIMIFEITRDYSIIVPLMIANLLSFFISQRLQPEPVYEALLHQDGVQLPPTRPSVAAGTLAHAVRPPAVVLEAHARVADVMQEPGRHSDTHGNAFPVMHEGRFIGMVRHEQLEAAVRAGGGAHSLRDVVSTADRADGAAYPHVHVDQSVETALQRMGRARVRVLPVVSRSDSGELLGIVTLDQLPVAFADRAESASTEQDTLPVRALLSVVVVAVVGLFLMGAFLANHYNSARRESAAEAFGNGRQLVATGRPAEAIERFRAALSMDGRDEYRRALGLALAETGRGADALTYLREVARTAPDDAPVQLAMARIARAAGDAGPALDDYRRAIAGAWPDGTEDLRAAATFECVEMLEHAGDSRQAMGLLLQLAGTTSSQPTLNDIGWRLLSLGTPEQAAGVFRQAIRSAPDDPRARVGLGQTLLAMHDPRGARTAFGQALALEEAPAARAGLALAERILSMDPSARGLTNRERYAKSVALLTATVAVADACPSTSPPETGGQVVADARRRLASRSRPASYGDATELNVQLAGALWKGVAPDCPARVQDDALVRIFAHLEP